jgi:hypothetical protein
MPPGDRTQIVADGQSRIIEGYAARLHARLLRRATPLIQRARFLDRLVIRYRMSRFVRSQVRRHSRKLAPFEALYGFHAPPGSVHRGVSREATPNV